VLLHEGLGSVGLWRGFPAGLATATGARVLAFSRYGHGASDPPPRPRTPRFMHEEALDVLPHLLAATGIEKARAARAQRTAPRSRSSTPRRTPSLPWSRWAPHVFVEPLCLTEIRAAKETYETGGLRTRMGRHHRDPPPRSTAGTTLAASDCPHWSIEGRPAAGDRVPAAADPGRARPVRHSWAQLDAIERAVPGPVERVHLPCRHAPQLEAPGATLAASTRFLTRVAGLRSEDR
jgi:pimeloyl-ACP methyl ester carboxylesterase